MSRSIPADQRFSKRRRLLSAADFTNVFSRAKRSTDSYFTVLAKPTEVSVSRLGLAIAKRAVRLSVERNRVKRLAREVFRTTVSVTNLDFVVLAKSAVVGTDNKILWRSLTQHYSYLSESSTV